MRLIIIVETSELSLTCNLTSRFADSNNTADHYLKPRKSQSCYIIDLILNPHLRCV